MSRQGPLRFDPIVLGNHECNAWAAYYRHDWPRLLAAAVGMVHAGFGLGRRPTLQGAWYVLRANQAWAPYPDNDPDRARDLMRRFYTLVAEDGALRIDPVEAARLEVEWWRLHRIHQREEGVARADLIAGLVALYAYVYDVEPVAIHEAAELRVKAMDLSDAWVEAGCDPLADLLMEERRTLVASYSALRRAVDEMHAAS